MGRTVPIDWARAKRNPGVRYRLVRINATREAFEDDESWQAMLRRSAEPVDGANPWQGNQWAALYHLEDLIQSALGEERFKGLSEDDADPAFRWWDGRMKAVFCTYYVKRAHYERQSLLLWAQEEMRRRLGVESATTKSNPWEVLAVLEERIGDEINRELRKKSRTAKPKRRKRAARGEGGA
jgi:hypothetical protein